MATMVASCFALLGIVIMLGPTAGGPQLGDLLAVLGTISQALMTVIIRRNPDVKMVPMAWASIVLSVVISYPLAEHLWDLTVRDYVVAAGFGLGPMTLGMMLYVIGSGLIPSTLTALINTMEAPIGALWAWVGVGEVPAVETIIGGALCSQVCSDACLENGGQPTRFQRCNRRRTRTHRLDRQQATQTGSDARLQKT